MGDGLAEAIAAFQGGDLAHSRDLAERQLEAGPSPPLHHLLGLLDCREGKLDSGIAWLRRAFEAEPGNISFRLMLVRALIDGGHGADAFDLASRPCAIGLAELPLWHARCEAADAANHPEAAAEAAQILCTAGSLDWHVWATLGRNLFKLERFADSERAYRQALALAPTEAGPICELGLVYERTNQHELLAELLDSSLGLGIAREQLAELWAIRGFRDGRVDEARELLDRSIPGPDPAHWHYLRAKLADAADDPICAFDAAMQMNRATPEFEEWRVRAAAYRCELRDLADRITPEWAARLPAPPPSAPPSLAFLVGFPRSGTTLLDTFLMGHAGITVIEEKGLLVASGRSLGRTAELPDRSAAKIGAARATYLDLLGNQVDEAAGLIVDKAPLNLLAMPLIHCLFGSAPTIFVQRHPCDAVLSGFMQSFTANLGMASFLDIADAADFYDAAMRVWTASIEALPVNSHKIVYEDLVRDPETTLRPLVDFLGLGWDERMLDHRSTASARGHIANPSYNQVTEALHGRAIGRWRRYEKQLEPVLPVLLPWAERLGYRD